jgi:hypothetical protein
MKALDLIKLIGSPRIYPIGGLEFDVVIRDAKVSYGNILVEIHPVAGFGAKWVMISSLKH